MINRRDVMKGALAGATLTQTGLSVFAQEAWPARPLHTFIGFAAGSGADIICRVYTTKLQDLAKQTVVPENRPGAVGSIAINLVASAKPDGSSILFTGNTLIAAGRHMLKNFTLDYEKDLVCAGGLFETPFVMVVGSKSSVRTIDDLRKHLKGKAKSHYGYTNPAAMVAGFAFKQALGVDAEAVAYKVTPDAVGDLEAGSLDYQIMDGTFAAGQAKQGRLRIVASTTGKRINVLPDVPTMEEQGMPDFLFSPWWAAWLPKGTPEAIAMKLNDYLATINKDPSTAATLASVVALPTLATPAEVKARLAADRVRWDRLAAAAGLKPS